MAHFLQNGPDPNGFACHDVEGAEFGRHDVFDDFGSVEDGSVVVGVEDALERKKCPPT